MHRHLSLEELPRKVAELGYEWIELSPRDDFLAWWVHPRANPERVASFKRVLKDHGVKIASLLPMYRWAPRTRTSAGRRSATGRKRPDRPTSATWRLWTRLFTRSTSCDG